MSAPMRNLRLDPSHDALVKGCEPPKLTDRDLKFALETFDRNVRIFVRVLLGCTKLHVGCKS